MAEPAVTPCVHWWVCSPAQDGEVPARCRRCGERYVFRPHDKPVWGKHKRSEEEAVALEGVSE